MHYVKVIIKGIIEVKVNEEIRLNLLENMLLLFAKVHAFSFGRDVKKKV